MKSGKKSGKFLILFKGVRIEYKIMIMLSIY